MRNAERYSLAIQIISVFFLNLFQSKYFQSDERRWGIEWTVGTLNIGYYCCMIAYIFYFRGFFRCSGHSKKHDEDADIQLISNPLRNRKDDILAPPVRRLTIRRYSTNNDSGMNTDLHLRVNPVHVKTNKPKTLGRPVRRSSTIV